MDKLVDAFIKVFSVLTVSKVLIWALFLVISLAGYTAYEHRNDLFNKVAPPPVAVEVKGTSPVLGAPTGPLLADLKEFVDKSRTIIAVQIVDVDLARNTRNPVWNYSRDPNMQAMFDDFMKNKPGLTPWRGNDPVNNARIDAVVRGDASCTPIAKTNLRVLMPLIESFAHTVCVVGIEPPQGEFTGYLSFHFILPPNEPQQDQLVNTAREFSARIR